MLNWWQLRGRAMLTHGYGKEEEEEEDFNLLGLFEQHVDDVEDEHPQENQDEPDPVRLMQLVENRFANQQSCAEEIQSTEEEMGATKEEGKPIGEESKTRDKQLAELYDDRVVEADSKEASECWFELPAGVPPTCSKVLSEAKVTTSGARDQAELFENLARLEEKMQHFCEYAARPQGFRRLCAPVTSFVGP